ncbi:MAG: hypothetical protein Q8933_10300 [Bacteroidota bacterium]|nr:hypothetical protein [Bacteroidota bacterium]MDP4191323.1 hypothetical protein [Bacteroidota bacterium]MDP4195802.1 hypothetical protein [Bacteroidota bacterium]
MEIKGIGNHSYIPLQDIKKVQTPPAEVEKKQDKLEISNEAKVLQSNNEKTKDLSVIQQRIKDNFYNTDQVVSATADAILKQIKLK